MKTPTMQEALNQVSAIVQDVKATKAEHMYLEQCVLALTEAVRVYEIAHEKRAPEVASFDEVKSKRKKQIEKQLLEVREVKHDA